jgi:hypothetical protein
MERDNPYAPPVETPDSPVEPPVVGEGGLALSEEGWNIVSSMAKWMRIVSGFLYALGALLGVAFLIVLVSGGSEIASSGAGAFEAGMFAGAGVMMIVVSVLMFFAATWLRQAAFHFYDGILSNTELALATGFRKLRLYLILYGLYAILGLAGEIYNLVG